MKSAIHMLIGLFFLILGNVAPSSSAQADEHLTPCYTVTSVTIEGTTHPVTMSEDGKYWIAMCGDVCIHKSPVVYNCSPKSATVYHLPPTCSSSHCSCSHSQPASVVVVPNYTPHQQCHQPQPQPYRTGGQCYSQPRQASYRRMGGGHSPQFLHGNENVQIQQKVVQLGIGNRVGANADSGDTDDKDIGGGRIIGRIIKGRLPSRP